jgi:hypothetical protein
VDATYDRPRAGASGIPPRRWGPTPIAAARRGTAGRAGAPATLPGLRLGMVAPALDAGTTGGGIRGQKASMPSLSSIVVVVWSTSTSVSTLEWSSVKLSVASNVSVVELSVTSTE